MQVAIINYNAGNIRSVDHALKRIGIDPVITADGDVIRQADKVIFPGQGEANSTMQFLRERGMDRLIVDLKQPVLGICIGMQLLCRHSEEGNTDCLGIFDAGVVCFRPQRWEDKVPHIGWNDIYDTRSPLFAGIPAGEYVYFVHSYCVPPCRETVATTDYIQPFSAALHRDNFYATQFHPEKSGSTGERILKNFIAL
jgi:glutamine amidotransferase